MRRSDARRAVIVGSAALLLLGPTVALAQADPAPAPAAPSLAEQAAQLPAQLVAAVQRDLKISPEQYLQRADLSQQLAHFTDIARVRYPAAIASSWLDQAGNAVVGLAVGPNENAARAAVQKAGFQVEDVAKGDVNTQVIQVPALPDPTPAAAHATDIGDVVAAGPLEGGDEYAAVKGNDSLRCSLGFNGTDSAGNVVNISAGHCDPNLPAAGTPNATPVFEMGQFDQMGPQIGSFEKTVLNQHDYSLIRATNDARGRFSNNLVDVPGAPPVAITGTAVPVVGAPVCKSGSRTGFSCGVVTDVNQSVKVGDRTLNNAFAANICALPGDSGGAIVTGTRALGISTASTVAQYSICAIPNIIGAVTGQPPALIAMPINIILGENPGLRVRTS